MVSGFGFRARGFVVSGLGWQLRRLLAGLGSGVFRGFLGFSSLGFRGLGV